MRKVFSILICGMLSLQESVSAEVADTLKSHQLVGVEIKGKRLRSNLREMDGVSIIDMKMMDDMPRILGNADPVHYVQLLPGVQTNSEYDAGLHIQGCDNSHNYVSLGGVPIYNAAHLLGFFSIFNAGHFSNMSLVKSSMSASFPNRLGGNIDMCTPVWLLHEDSLALEATHGELSVGPMSSQATLKMPVGKRSLLLLSARAAYLNLLYSRWLEIDDDHVCYDFSDYNLSYITQLNESNVLKAEAYWGYDKMKWMQDGYGLDATLKWDNTMAALHWYLRHKKLSSEQMVYFTRYACRMNIDEQSFNVGVRSYIYDIGYKGQLTVGRWNLGTDLIRHELMPQNIDLTGSFANYLPEIKKQEALEASAYVQYSQPLSAKFSMEVGTRFAAYHRQATYYGVMPNFRMHWDVASSSKLTLNLGIHHQYLFQTGFSSAGLPIEFWASVDASHRPQYAYNASLQGEFWLFDKEYRLSVETYSKWLDHPIENNSNVFDILYSSYSFDNSLLHGKGYNYGVNLLLEKRRGKLTGWLSYSFGRAWRKFDSEQYEGWYPANHERIHEFNAVATYKIGKKINLGATYVLASGTPYTHVNYAYLIANNIVTEYGPHNGARVNPYMRLDLSISYDFSVRGSKRSGINFSLYNVTMHNNDLFYRIKVYKDHVRYCAFRFFMPMLPSINYYYKF